MIYKWFSLLGPTKCPLNVNISDFTIFVETFGPHNVGYNTNAVPHNRNIFAEVKHFYNLM